ncbi:DUF4132 domain-containing protein [Chitinophaga solisilvae]|uniref:DUF4132 domain-containing protein n=1 Tax=Chitinophaga solisilvae TaxID=1233460 RepID=UPI00136C8056|nr:DUF4132 domain-containing protein [Chitinophaga solisilvae]
MPYTKETILPFIEQRKQLNEHNDINAQLQAGVDFLTGQIITAPVIQDAESARQMGVFIQLLRLPDQWDDNDRLILQLLADPLTWQECRERFLQHIVPLLDAPGTSSSIVLRFSYFTSYLQQRGCTPEEIGSYLISYSGDGNNYDLTPLKFTPLRKFLQDLIKSAEWHVVDAWVNTWKQKGWNSLFYRLLSKAHPERETAYLESVLQQPFKGQIHYELTRVLLQNNIAKYETLIAQSTQHLAQVPDYAARLMGYYSLAAHQPEKYNTLLTEAAYAYLEQYNTTLAGQLFRQPAGAAEINDEQLLPEVVAVKEILVQDKFSAITYLEEHLTDKRYLHPLAFKTIREQLGNRAVSLLLSAVEKDYDARIILPQLMQLDRSLYFDRLWDFTLHKLKSVRTLVAVILAEHPQALEKAGELLQHKKAEQRLTAVQILCRLNSAAARELLQQALHREINDDARDLMLETLGDTITGTDNAATVGQLIAFAKKRGKLSRPLEKWLDDATLPPLFLQDGTLLTQDMMRFLLYRMSRVKEIRSDAEARPLLQLIDRQTSGQFAAHLFSLYSSNNGDAKLRYLLTLAALVGDDQLATQLEASINHWISDKRLKMAEAGVGALAIHGSNKALQAVELMSRKYRVRKSNVGAAALAGLQNAANELGITIHELGDRIVPDFGFQGLFKPFLVKGDTYCAYIDHNFRPAFINDKNRRLKAIPVATPAETKEAFKALSKEVAAQVKLQTQRLEHYLVVQRKWIPAQWQQFFLNHPVMFVYANRLLWALYDENDRLLTCFQCRDNRQLLNLHQEVISIPDNATIRLLHPLYLDDLELLQWKQRFAEQGIVQVFPQLDRPVAALSPQQADTTLVHDFEDISLESALLNKHMEQKGWKLSEGSDGKYVYAYHKTDDDNQLEVIVEMSTVFTEESFRYKLGKLYFIDKTKARQRWFRSTDKEAADCLLPLRHVPPVFYSEAITDIAVSGGLGQIA